MTGEQKTSSADEIWKKILDFEDLYEISSYGRIRNIRTRRLLRWNITKFGYARVRLYKEVSRSFFVHRLVGEAFVLGKTNERKWINHKNGIKLDNNANNLEWVTCSQNSKHAVATGLKRMPEGESHHNSRLKSTDIAQIIKLHLVEGISQREIARHYKINYQSIWAIFNRGGWKHVLSAEEIELINGRVKGRRGKRQWGSLTMT